QVLRGARMAGTPRWLVIIRGDFQRENREEVRKKLRSTAQLLAHLAAGLAPLGLQGNLPLKYYGQLRNFLRTMARCLYGGKDRYGGKDCPIASDQKIAACGSSYIWNAFPL
ncbi:hypothetical protein, partial [Pseudomonas sp. CCNWLW23]|uniref:hypothetical protein n=2 Tax=unclassified Pseudomonas TaxID=196821 RepID=UPI003012AD40